jgi:hypothetical protein
MGSTLHDDEGEASRIFGIPTNVTLGAPQWERFRKAVKISEDGLSLFVAANAKQGQQTALDVFSFVDDDWNKTQCIVGEDGGGFGSAIDLSEDWSILVIGALSNDSSNDEESIGRVHIYTNEDEKDIPSFI